PDGCRQQGRQDAGGGPPPGARQRYSRKKARSSVARATGSSIAAKWPPAGITVQRRMLYMRSAHERGGRTISLGKAAYPVGTSMRWPSAMGHGEWKRA